MDTKVIEEKIDSLLDAVKNSREYEEYKKQEELLDQGIKPNTIRLSIGALCRLMQKICIRVTEGIHIQIPEF